MPDMKEGTISHTNRYDVGLRYHEQEGRHLSLHRKEPRQPSGHGVFLLDRPAVLRSHQLARQGGESSRHAAAARQPVSPYTAKADSLLWIQGRH